MHVHLYFYIMFHNYYSIYYNTHYIFEPNIGAPEHIDHILTDIKGKTGNNINNNR